MRTEITNNQSHPHQMAVPLKEQAEAVTEEGGMKSLLMKRTAAAKLIGIGKTVFNELGDPLHRNFDPSFPKPVRRITPNGPIYFKRDDIVAWVASLAAESHFDGVAANDAAFGSSV